MRTRNADSAKSATPKKTPPARNSATKTTSNFTIPAGESANSISPPARRTRQVKKKVSSPAPNSISDSKPQQSPEEAMTLGDAAQVAPDTKVATTPKSAKKKTPGRPRTSTKAVATPKEGEQLEAAADETLKMDNFEEAERAEEPRNVVVVNADTIESEKEGEQGDRIVGQSEEKEQNLMEVDEPFVENVCESAEKGKNLVEVDVPASQDASISFKQEKHTILDLNISVENEDFAGANEEEKGKEVLKEHEGVKDKVESKEEETNMKGREELKEQEGGKEQMESKEEETNMKGKEELKEQVGDKEKVESKEEETNIMGHKEESNTESFSVEVKNQLQQDVNPVKDGDEETKSSEKLDLGEQGEEDLFEEDPEEDPEEPHEETETLEEENMELDAIARQRKIKKEHEIFVGGLDRDATEEDLRKVFERTGEILEVRLHKNSSTNKNKGYAFVKFANKDNAKKALLEMKNPVICGKRCGTAPSEDNDTLFLGNICNTWTKEAIKQKLKDYGVEGVENITLVPDVQHEGLSRGFAFLEFSCHADAMLAYKRLQKPDSIFGHAERSAKVAFAEPLREPDPEVMAQVKSVFINGLPPHWDEDHVRELFKSYGEIVRIVLARNMSTAKRKDYGFVDFSTHEAAVACVDGINKSELGDEGSKIKVRARLSNPLPKTPAVKGGMCGGFRINRARSGALPRAGRGFGRGGQPFSNWGNFDRDRNSYHGRHSQIGRMGFRDDLDFNMYPDFHQRQFGPQGHFGERRGPVRAGHYAGSQGAAFAGPSRPYLDRAWYGVPEGGPREPIPPRRPYSPGGQFDRPFVGRHFDDLYLYDDNAHGVKRPFYMTDPEPDYMGPSRFRPRLDYADPALFHGTAYHGSFGVGSRHYPHDYYGSDYGGGPFSSFHGGDSSHGHGYYY